MAEMDLVELVAIAQSGGTGNPLPEHILQSSTVIDLQAPNVVTNGVLGISFDPETAQFISVFGDDLVVVTEGQETIVIKDFVPAVTDGFLISIELLDGVLMDAPEFLEEYGVGTNIADALSDIDTAAGDSSTQNSVTNFAEGDRFTNEEFGNDGIGGGPSGALGSDGVNRFDRANGSGRPFGGRDGNPSNRFDQSNGEQQGQGSSGGPARDTTASTPTLDVGETVLGLEDVAIPLTISAALTDLDGSETLAITISGLPEGASLNAGYYDAVSGAWVLTAEELNGLSLIPAENASGNFSLTVHAIAVESDGGARAITSDTLDVDITPGADAPTLTLSAASGSEDTAIALDISSALTDTDGSETLSVEISGIPDGAVLTADGEAVTVTDGVATLTPAQLANLSITPPANSSDDFDLTVTATSTDGSDTATTTATLPVSVTGVADAPTLSTEAASGSEDTAIALDISSALTDGSETLSVEISGIPDGAVLTADGEAVTVTDGVATLTPAQLANLSITPPANSSDDFDLTVTATSTDGTDTATTTATLPVSVTGVADAATVATVDAAGSEDTAIALNIDVTGVQDGDSASITISDIPAGATLSAGTVNEDGSVTLTPAELEGLTITPAADSDADFTLSVAVTTTDGESGDTSTVTDTLDVTVEAVADAPTLSTEAASGSEDTAIALDISSALTDTDGSETLSVEISGIPDGAVLTADGEAVTVTDGVATLTPAQLANLTITPPANSSDDFDLTVTATSTDGSDTATTTATLPVSVTGVADAPTLSAEAASGSEDTAIALDISSALTDDSETLSVEISGIPDGAVLTADGEAVTVTDGVATLTPAQLANLTITPPANSSDDFDLTVTATSTDGSDTATTTATLPVSVTGVADAPTLSTEAASGSEDTAIALDISSALTDDSETLSVEISGIPDGAVLTADGEAVTVTDGVATLTPAQLANLTITPPANSSDDFDLTVTATSTDGSDTATTTATLPVSVTGVADAATVATADAVGSEDTAIALDIAVTGVQDGDSTSITISDIPTGATLSAGTVNEDGSVTLTPAELEGLTITPAADSDADFTLSVAVTTTDGESGDTSTVTDTLDVTVDAVADTPTLSVDAASGSEDTAIALDISSALTDTDGSETLSVEISGIPDGAVLTADGEAVTVTDGVATLTPAQLANLTITPPANSSDDFDLTVTATSTDGSDTATTTATLPVSVTGVADAATVATADTSGNEDTAIALNIDVTGVQDGDSASITISDIPAGATLSAGTVNEDGSVTLTPAELEGLTITPAADSDADFTLSVAVTTTDGESGDTSTVTDTLDVTVDAVADAPTLSVEAASGSEDTAITLDISSALTDTDGSETLSVEISGIPDGAVLTADGEAVTVTDGVATLTPAQLANLTITPPANSSDDFDLTVTATSTDGSDTATTTATLPVSVTGVADAPTLSAEAASGNEDTAIALDISSALTDDSETLSVEISGIPDGAVLTADGEAVTVTDGVATLTPDQLANLSITPPANSSNDFDLTVIATSTDGSDTATTTATLPVTVTGVADAATVATADAAGSEDTAIALNIDVTGVQDGDSASITISDIPTGATLSAGTVNEDGSVTLTPAELAGLTITPAADSDADFTLSVAVTTTDGESGDTSTVTDTLDVTVDAVADAPTLSVDAASGSEDTAIALDISSALTDTDGSETLSVEISGIPDGAVLTADGEAVTVTDGVATLTPAQLANLTITPPANSSDDFDLTVTATSTDGSDTATTTATLPVSVTGVADAPTLSAEAASGNEDTAIALDISSALTDDSETLSVEISGIPDGAVLTADGEAVTVTDGVATLTPAQLANLSITPPENSSDDFTLTVTATSTDGSDTATTTATLPVSVTGVADAATVATADTSGNEDTAIALNIDVTGVQDGDSASITISDIPAGATLSAGTVNEDGSVTLTPAELEGLTITPAADSDADFTLSVAVTTTDGESGDTSTVTDTLDVTVDAVADAPTLSVDAASGSEDTAIALDISSTLTDTDGSETLSVEISGIPDGAVLTADGEAVTVTDGVATLTPAQLANLSITPPANSSDDFDLTVTATSTDGSDTATTTATLPVSVTGVADAPTLSTEAASGSEDTAIALDISSALTDDSETLSVEISGIPDGAVLTADGEAVTVTDGVATLTPAQLANLTITPPANSSDDFDLTVTATSTDGSDTATTTATLPVSVTGVADAATVATADAAGSEDTAIAIDIDVTGVQDGDSASITISDIPAGATLSAGTVNEDGSVTLTPAELEGLTITPAADSDADFTLSVAVTTTDGESGDTSTVTDTLDVTVDAVADAPTLSVDAASGSEDTAITLDISSALTDTDGSETLSVEISGIPDGAVLTADGEAVTVTDGVATLTPAQLANLTITPPANSSDDFDLTVTATSTDGTDTATTTATLPVSVTGVADAPTLSVEAASGVEDSAIELDLSAALTDDSETLSVEISGIPDGAVLTADGEAVTVTDGVATLTPAQLANLTITPPANSSDDFDLTVTATSTDGSDTATTTATLPVSVTGVADAPTLSTEAASGSEDTAIALDISSALTDDSETLSVEISGIPDGAVLTADGEAVTVTDGVATLTPAQLANLTITPPANSSDDFDLTVTATSTDGSDTATTTATLPVSVTGVADAPTLSAEAASGNEDTAIALDISSALTDDSETLSVEISGIPDGAVLTADGEAVTVTDGVATLTPDQLANLSITPPANSSNDFDLTVIATSTDGSDTATTTATLPVTVTGVADAATVATADAAGSEDTAIALNIDVTGVQDGDSASITISDIPTGATLSAGTVNEDGSVTLTPAELAGLTITPAADSDADFTLSVAVTTTDGESGDTSTVTDTLDVTVDAVADAPTLSVDAASGSEDTAIALDISSALTDTDGSETLSVEISGIPDGAVLTADGEAVTVTDGVATLTPAQLANLTITPPANSSDDFDLTVTATSTDGSDTATTTATLPVSVTGVADAPTLSTEAASGSEDTAIALDISSALTDDSETLSVEISGIPDGAVLTADGEAVTVTDGVATLTPAQLANLSITPPENSSDDFTLTVTATSTDGSDTATTTATLPVSVTGVADAATVATADTSGNEDTAIALNIDVTGVQDGDSASITISDIPAGATLSAGTVNEDGSVTLTPAELEGLTITPAADSDADFTLSVAVTTTDGESGDTSTVTDTLDVTVDAVADAPTLSVDAASGSEDTAITLDISSALTDTDGSETLSVEISGIPDGAVLTADGEAVTVTDGVATLTPAQLANLTITPPANSSDDFDLTVTATSTDGSDTATTTATLPVSVTGVADAPTLSTEAASGSEDTAIALDISSALTDDSETLSVEISGIPDGAVLTADGEAVTVTDGVATLTPAQLANLTITPPANSSDDFDLTVTATSTDGSDTATTTATLPVSVTGVADAATVATADAAGSEDTAIAIDIDVTGVQDGDSASITISDIPAGATLSAGTVNEDGSVTLTPAELEGLTITPAADSDADFTLSVAVTTTDGESGDTSTVTDTLNVTVEAVADAPTLSVDAASGSEDTAIALDISSALTDTDGSETLSVEISGIPDGAVLTADGEAVTVTDGVATLTPAQLANLTITPPANSSDDFDLTVTATSTDGSDTATTTATLPVSVTGVADAPTLSTDAASGSEDTAIALDISSALTDTDGSETLSVEISGIPDGAVLTADGEAVTVTEGVATLTPAQLANLSITPPANSSNDFDLIVTATSTDGSDTATTTATLPVSVTGVADAATVATADAVGSEDTAIALNIDVTGVQDGDSASITISDIPTGATLSAGTVNEDGSVTLTPAELAGLTITPAADSDADFTLSVAVTTTDGESGDTSTVTDTLDVTVDAVADTPTLSVDAASGSEDTAIALDISSALTDTDGSETLSVEISGIPDGAVLTADGEAVTVTDGVATLTPAQLANLSITPPANSSDDFDLTVTATSTDGTDTATTTATLPVSVTGVADAATVATADAAGNEDTAIALNIDVTGVQDGDSASITISDIPTGATLSAGTVNEDGSVTLTPAELEGLTITPAADSDADFTLFVAVTTTDGESGDTSTVTNTLDITVDAVADAPTLSVDAASGNEDTAIALDISSALTDGSETLSVEISGIPDGAVLTADGEAVMVTDGVATLTPAQLANLSITPPANSSDDFDLTVAATSTDGSDTATTTATLPVTVTGVADAPTLSTEAASGSEDTAIALDISSALTDDSETLSVEISGIPDGAVLTADGEAVTVTDGVATLTPAQLANLTITPPANSSDDFDLTVTATSTDGSDTATTTATLPVTVTGVADAATVATADAAGSEDTAIALDIDVTGVQDGDSASITISDIPTGATLSAGTVNEDGSVTLTPAELEGLTITPAADSDADFTLSVAVTTTDGESGDTSTVTDTLDVTVDAVADAPTLSVEAASGSEDTAITLDISSALTDTDGSETLSVEISGIPDGAVLTADGEAVTVTDGVATLTPAQLANLTITPPANSSDDFDLTVTATSTDGSDTATTTATLPVSVTGVADAPTLSAEAASGNEDTAIALDISSALTDDSETLSVEISGIPDGAVLTADGEAVTVTDGVATLTPAQLANLTITPPANSSDDFDLTVTATSTDGSDTATTTATLPVSVTGVADAATVATADAAGSEDTAIAIDIDVTGVQDGDSASITISDIPTGATLSAGTVNEDGSVTLTPAELEGLTITPAADSDADFTLSVAVTTTDGESGDTSTVTDTLDVTVDSVADAPTLSVDAASGSEDTAIALDISSALTDTDGSETLSVEISGIPDGAILTADGEAVTVTDGVAMLTPAQLANLTITPPANSSDDFDLTVTATSTDGTDTATTTATLPVSVTGVADAPTLSVEAASGVEDSAIELDLSAALTDDSETLSVEISGIPDGAILKSGETVITVNDGVADLTPAQLANLTITPPENSSDDFTLTVTATSTDGTDTATTVGSIPITVTGVADAPELDVHAASGDEDSAIDLDISAALSDSDETLTVEISGIPNGATLTANGVAIAVTAGVATLTAGQLEALAITPPANSSDDFILTVTATSTDGTSTATTEGTIPVTVNAVADTPNMTVSAASGTEDHAIALNITANSDDSGETLSITIGDIPDGAVLMSGTTEISITDGEATLTPAQLADLSITPPSNSDEDFDLSVTVTSTDGSSTATQSGTLSVSVDPDADTPSLTLSGSTAVIDSVTVALTLPDSLSDSLTNATGPYDLPAGSGLSGQIFDTNGSMNSLSAADALIAAGGPDVSFTATTVDYDGGSTVGGFLGSDGSGATGTTGATADTFVVKIVGYIKIEAGSHNFSVTSDDGFRLKIGGETVTEFVSDRSPETSNGSFNAPEDGLYPIEIVYWENSGGQELNVQMDGTTLGGNILYSTLPEGVIANGDGSYSIPETVDTSTSLTISDLPDNAVLSAGTKNADGTWTVTPEQAEGLTVTYPDGAIHTVTATVTDSYGAELASADIMTGALQTFTAELNIQSALVDIDGSETLSIQISADSIPDGAVFSAGDVQADGSVILTADELDGLTVQFPVGTEDFSLSITATSTDGSDTASITQSLTVTVPDVQGGTYIGTEGADTIVGSAGNDVIYGDGDPNAAPGIVETPVNGIFHFAMEDTTWGSNETVTDSLNGITGTAKGDTGSSTGKNGNSAQFDGNGDYVVVPHSDAMELTKGTFSIDFIAWNNGTLASKDSSGFDDGGHFDLNINSNHVVELRVQTEDESFTLSGGSINYEDWQNASVTWDGETVTLYVNGTAVDSVASDWNLSENENPWTFGASQINSGDNVANNLTDYLNGKIDNPTLLDQPLSAEQIAAMHTNGIPATLASGLTVSSEGDDTTGSTTLLSEDFSNGSGSFTYSDGVFGTSNGYYESGASGASNGETGGGLSVTLGGQNNNSVSDMSGGWTTTINVDDATENTTLTFKVRMVYPADSESDEAAEVRVAVDGQLVGAGGQDYVMRYEGDGDGGSDYDSGWQTITLDLGSLPAGEHTITLGGYYEGKTTSDEEVNIFFDTVSVTGDSVFSGTTQVADRTEMFHTTFEDKNDGFHDSSDGWQTNSDKIEVRSDTSDNFGAATDGHNYIELNTDPDDIYADAASIYRDIQTEAGRVYELTFSYSGRPGYDDSVNSMLVSANGTSLGTFTHDMENNSSLDWQTVTVRFTGTGESMRLEFAENSNADVDGGRGMMLDDITLVDTGYGPSMADTIDGGAGSDTIFGGVGDDVIDGGTGDDVINGGTGADTIDGGAGSDTIDYSSSDEGVIIDFQNGIVSGGDAEGDSLTGIENITGSAHDDTLTGDAGDNRIQGGAGADTLDGGAGNDTLDYSDSDEAVTINFESGTVTGGDATGDQIANFENMLGSDFNDTLVGDDGDNRIDGGKGSDLLSGGDGADIFVLGSPGDGIDTITDFNIAEGDRLDVSSVVNMNDVDDIANYLKIEDDGAGNSTVMVNTSGDGEAAHFTAVASLEGVTNIDINSILQDQNQNGENV